MLTNQHGIINAVAETIDNHFLNLNAELFGETDKEVVGMGSPFASFLDSYGDGLGLGTPNDDGQTTARVPVAQNQDVGTRRGFAVGQADDFQTDFVHFHSFWEGREGVVLLKN